MTIEISANDIDSFYPRFCFVETIGVILDDDDDDDAI